MFDQIVQEIERQGFYTRPQVLSLQDLLLANDFFLNHMTEFNPAQVGLNADRKRLENIRGDLTFWLDSDQPPGEFIHPFAFLNELKAHLNKKLFLGLRDFEAHLAVYPPGSFYAKHRDRHKTKSTRVLSFVFYLNQEWNDDDGGELVLYDDKNNELLKVLPLPGTFICFLSEDFPHEVKPAKKERKSLTGWIHSTHLS